MTEKPARGVPLHTKILLGLILGAVCGVIVNLNRDRIDQGVSSLVGYDAEIVEPFLTNVSKPVGDIFLRLLLMTVVPLVFASLSVGVAKLGDLRRLGRIGARTLLYFLMSTAMAVTIGLTLVNLIQPGKGMPEETKQALLKEFGGQAAEKKAAPFGVQTFVNIIPQNPLQAASSMPPDMLGVIFFALLFGIALTRIDPHRSGAILTVLEGIGDVMVFIINLAMYFAPIGVFALIFTTCSRFGLGLIWQLGLYVGVVVLGLALHFFGVFSLLLYVFSRVNPIWFFRKASNVVLTAFSTSSSNATLPTTIKTAEEELGVPPQIAGFVLPLGATMNMNGTALFEGVTVLFISLAFGYDLGLGDQIVVVVLCVITAIGAAGVPGGSLPLLMMVLAAFDIPGQTIALVLGVDRLLDMSRTTLNVVGDLTAATYITRSEGLPLAADQPTPRDEGPTPI